MEVGRLGWGGWCACMLIWIVVVGIVGVVGIGGGGVPLVVVARLLLHGFRYLLQLLCRLVCMNS